MADKRDLLQFRHLENLRLERCKVSPVREIVVCRCGRHHSIVLQEGALVTIHCVCGRETQVMLEAHKDGKAA